METRALPVACPSQAPRAAPSRPEQSFEDTSDLFSLWRAACALRTCLFGQRGFFVRIRRLLPSGQWQGPRDAALPWVDARDLDALGGVARAAEQGVRTVIADEADALALLPALPAGLVIWWRVRFRRDDAPEHRTSLYARARALFAPARAPNAIEAILPWPEGEPMGLDTLTLFARLRTVSTRVDAKGATGGPHLVADFARLGPRLAQMCLTVGADGLFGPIVAERGLRLGENAHNPALTRREAATLLRGVGLRAHERLSADPTGPCFEELAP